jgi:hypothetical protein
MEALVEMAHRPEFLALTMPAQANRSAKAQEEVLLRSLSDSHRPEIVARLKVVLAGIREDGAIRSPGVMEGSDGSSFGAAGPISETTWQQVWESLHSAADPSPNSSTAPSAHGADTANASPPTTAMDPPSEPPQREGQERALWKVVGAVAVTVTLAAATLTALRANLFCTSLGLCSVEVIEAATAALAQAEQTAGRLNKADSLTDYDQATRELASQVRRIARDGVFSEAQRNNLKTLKENASAALERSKRENIDRRTVQEVRAKRKSIQSLPWLQAEENRLQLLQQLKQVSRQSFSHEEAQSLRQQLQRPQMQPPPAQEPNNADRQAAPAEIQPKPCLNCHGVKPREEPTLDWRGWSGPRKQPPPEPAEQGSADAPYRKEPLW